MMERIYFIYKHAVPHKGSAKKREPLIEKKSRPVRLDECTFARSGCAAYLQVRLDRSGDACKVMAAFIFFKNRMEAVIKSVARN